MGLWNLLKLFIDNISANGNYPKTSEFLGCNRI